MRHLEEPIARRPVSLAARDGLTGRRAVVRIITGSTSEFGWLPTNTTGPEPGMWSEPTTSMVRKKIRVTRRRKPTITQ